MNSVYKYARLSHQIYLIREIMDILYILLVIPKVPL